MNLKMSTKSINIIKMLLLYRYISLIGTSLFYVIGIQEHDIWQRLFVIMGMVITSGVMNYLYLQNKGDKSKILIIVIIETIGNCIILIPSGGLQSPYIWYVFNTIIIAGVELGSLYLWGSVGLYLASMISITYRISQLKPIASGVRLGYVNIVTGFILVAVIIELLIRYTKQLEEQTKKSEQYLDYTMKIYNTVYLFTSQGNREGLIQVIFEYLRDQFGVASALFLEFREEDEIAHTYGLSEESTNQLVEQIQARRMKRIYDQEELDILDYGQGLIGMPIKYTYSTFGVLIVSDQLELEELKFIGYVSGMILKKIELEQINKGLLLGQEQNRIANEIHDSVIQKLFGVSCGLFMVTKKIDTLEKDRLVEEINGMRTNLTQAMTELRATIYGLSWNKSGKNSFLEKLENYKETMSSMNSVDIDIQIEGNIEQLSVETQKALYRICCEAIANGIRHGKADKISIIFDIGIEGVEIQIVDNGEGFDYEQVVSQRRLGLGIRNMEQLAISLGGEFRMDSSPSKGTTIWIHLVEAENALEQKTYKKGII